MPPTPPIPHEYYLPSPPESPTCPQRIYSKSNFGNPGIEVSRQKRRTVRFSDHISIRIIFGGASEDDRDLVIDTQLVDAFGFGPAFGVGPPVLWLSDTVVVKIYYQLNCSQLLIKIFS